MNEKQKEELFARVKSEEKQQLVHVPYCERSGEAPDFEVDYCLSIDDSLKVVFPSQGMRCDFLCAGVEPKTDRIHIIWPEILDEHRNVILDKSKRIPNMGKAFMWIGDPDARENVHKKRIKVGTKGRWVVGSKTLANVVVTKLIRLAD